MATATSQSASAPALSGQKFKADSLLWGVLFALLLTVVQRVVGLLRSILFCRLLPDSELGQWSLVYSFLVFFAPLVILGLPGSFGRYVEHYRQRGHLKKFLARITWLTVIMSISAMLAMFFAGKSFSWFIFGNSNQQSDMLLLGFVLLVVIWHNFLAELLESLRQIKLVAWMRFINSIVFAIVSISGVYVHGPFVSSLVVGFVAGAATGSIPGIWYLLRNHRKLEMSPDQQSFSMWRKVLPYAAWIWAINALTNLFAMADRYMLLHCSQYDNDAAQSAVGQYYSGMLIPMILANLSVLVSGALMPYMALAWEQNRKDETSALLRTALKLSAIGFTLAGLLLLMTAPVLFHQFLQNRYEAGLSLLPIAFAYYIWFALSSICLTYLFCAEKGWYSVISLGIGLLANLALNVILIPDYGIYGAVTATLISNGISLGLIYLLSWCNGWRIDLGVILTSLLPLALLLETTPALGVVTCATVLIFHGNRILDVKEKAYVERLWNHLKQKLTAFTG
jgi:O-antigen/teichoic acid export membrane protein